MFIKLTCAFTGSDLLINLDKVELIEQDQSLTNLYFNYDENDSIKVKESLNEIESKAGKKIVIGK